MAITAGELDPDFADRGRLVLGAGFAEAQLRKAYALATGSLLCVGSLQRVRETTHRFAAARVTATGRLDRSFADAGYLLGEPAEVSVHRFSGMVSDAQGELFLVGNFADKARDELLHYGNKGEFLKRWPLTLPRAMSNSTHPTIAMQPGGKLWVCSSRVEDGASAGVLYRRLPEGEADTGFVEEGAMSFSLDGAYVLFNDLTVTADGHVVVAADIHARASARVDIALCCFDLDSGHGVAGFGVNGRFVYPSLHSFYRWLSIRRIINSQQGLLAIIQAYGGDGAIYSFFVRVTAQGELDDQFNGGKPIVLAGAYADVAVQSDGRIIALASNFYPETEVRRYMPNGEEDWSFGAGGAVLLGQPGERLYTLAVQADDKVVVSGQGQRSVLYRLLG